MKYYLIGKRAGTKKVVLVSEQKEFLNDLGQTLLKRKTIEGYEVLEGITYERIRDSLAQPKKIVHS
jgi:hypothetical protein